MAEGARAGLKRGEKMTELKARRRHGRERGSAQSGKKRSPSTPAANIDGERRPKLTTTGNGRFRGFEKRSKPPQAGSDPSGAGDVAQRGVFSIN